MQAYSSIAAYSMIDTDHPVLVYTSTGSGQPSAGSRPFAGLTSASDGIVNASVGGHALLLKGRDLRLHAGVGSNRSPVAPEDLVLNGQTVQSAIDVGMTGFIYSLAYQF